MKVGVAAVQLARAHGMRVLGSAGSDLGSKVVKEAGAHEVFNHKENGYLDKVMVRIMCIFHLCLITNLVLFHARFCRWRFFWERAVLRHPVIFSQKLKK